MRPVGVEKVTCSGLLVPSARATTLQPPALRSTKPGQELSVTYRLTSLLPFQSTVASRVPAGGRSTFWKVAVPAWREKFLVTRTVRVGFAAGGWVMGVEPVGESPFPQAGIKARVSKITSENTRNDLNGIGNLLTT